MDNGTKVGFDPVYKSNISVSLSYYDRSLLEGIAQSLRVIETDITEHLRPLKYESAEEEATHAN